MPNLKKKILYLVTQAEWGGAQRYVFDLATHLAEEFEITIATGTNGASQELIDKIRDKRYEIKILCFKHLRRNINPYHDLMAVFEIAKFLRQNHFDIIHLNSSKAGVIGALATWLTKKTTTTPHQLTLNSPSINPKSTLNPKILYTAHGWVYLEPLPFWRRWIYLIMEKIAARLRDATIVLSEKEKAIALKYGTGKKDAAFVIPNGINLDNLKFLDKEEAKNRLNILTFKHLNNCIIIGTIANLYKTKGLEFLIEAVKILNIQYPISNIKTIVIGDGSERKNLELRIMNYELGDKVILTGTIPNAYQYLKAFDIFVLPSVKEGFPYTILEAMAAGLPIVATKVGAIPEILENQKTGVLVPSANSMALAKAIGNLIDSPEKTNNLALNAQEGAKQFSLDKTIEETKKLYQ